MTEAEMSKLLLDIIVIIDGWGNDSDIDAEDLKTRIYEYFDEVAEKII
jgi:hypothetical protein